MKVIPAIDLKGGKVVRLEKGAEGTEKEYSDDAAAVAAEWKGQGAELLHVVDLDGAFSGKKKNFPLLRQIVSVGLPVQFGGGIRSLKDAEELFSLGVGRIVLGTLFFYDQEETAKILEKFDGKVLVSIDCVDGKATVKGWVEKTGVTASEAAQKAEEKGAAGVVVTDVSKDGMLSGPNCELVGQVVDSVKIPVIASGGISCLDDLKKLEKTGCSAAIVGKALYEKKFSLKEAIEAVGD